MLDEWFEQNIDKVISKDLLAELHKLVTTNFRRVGLMQLSLSTTFKKYGCYVVYGDMKIITMSDTTSFHIIIIYYGANQTIMLSGQDEIEITAYPEAEKFWSTDDYNELFSLDFKKVPFQTLRECLTPLRQNTKSARKK